MEGQQQAANQVSVSNSIGSLRLLGTMDWREFVEALSGVEQTLRDDPSGVYAQMDFDTRDRYRHAVEAIAKLAETAEIEVARQAVALCAAAARRARRRARTAGVGTWASTCSAPGGATLERRVGARVPRRQRAGARGAPRALPHVRGRDRALARWRWPRCRCCTPSSTCSGPGGPTSCWPRSFSSASSQLAMALVNWLVTAVRRAAAAAAHGLQLRHRLRVANAGRGADHAGQRRRRGSARRGARGALSCQPRSEPALRPADGPARRARPSTCPATRRWSNWRPRASRR